MVEEIARGWMSVGGIVNTHFIVAYMIMQHGTDAQKKDYLPRLATGEIRGSFSMSGPTVAPMFLPSPPAPSARATSTSSTVRRCG